MRKRITSLHMRPERTRPYERRFRAKLKSVLPHVDASDCFPNELLVHINGIETSFYRLFYGEQHNVTYIIDDTTLRRTWTHYVVVEHINYLFPNLTQAYAFQAEYGGRIYERNT